MKYKDIGFRGFYKHFVSVPIKENFTELLKDFPGYEDANCILTYGYIDREAGLTLEILALGQESESGFVFFLMEMTTSLSKYVSAMLPRMRLLSLVMRTAIWQKDLLVSLKCFVATMYLMMLRKPDT